MPNSTYVCTLFLCLPISKSICFISVQSIYSVKALKNLRFPQYFTETQFFSSFFRLSFAVWKSLLLVEISIYFVVSLWSSINFMLRLKKTVLNLKSFSFIFVHTFLGCRLSIVVEEIYRQSVRNRLHESYKINSV